MGAGVHGVELAIHTGISVLRMLMSLVHFYETEPNVKNVSMIFGRATAGKAEIVGFFRGFSDARMPSCRVNPAWGSVKPKDGFHCDSIPQYSINRESARAVYSTSGITRS